MKKKRSSKKEKRPVDIHRQVASKLFGVPEDRVTPEMRSQAKIATFGALYGATVSTFKGEAHQ